MSKVAAIIQARMGSTRLPGKVMKNLCGQSVLAHVIERVKQSDLIDEIIIATTVLDKDDVIVDESKNYDVKYYRGSEENVLSRYYYAAKENNIDTIVRITSDCPLIDPFVVDEIIKSYKENNYRLVTNAGPSLEDRTYPRGLDTEVFSFKMLKRAFEKSEKEYQLEHVTPYIYENNEEIYYYKNETDYSNYRLTLDEDDDLKLIKIIYSKLYNGEHDFYLNEIIELMKQNSKLVKINSNVEQKKL
ncbi:NTP transferase domain-containing protein [Halanaerocella petrolearia]